MSSLTAKLSGNSNNFTWSVWQNQACFSLVWSSSAQRGVGHIIVGDNEVFWLPASGPEVIPKCGHRDVLKGQLFSLHDKNNIETSMRHISDLSVEILLN